MKTLSWLIRRELWENKAIWAMPLIVGALLLLAATFGDIDLGPAASLMPPDQPRVCGTLVLFGFGVALFFVMTLYSIWYLLDCLYIDRKDRSVLFWRALPVSDTQAVLSKLATALIVIPLVSFAAADVTTLGMALAITLRGKGASDVLWQSQNWLQLQVLWVYLMATMAIWYLPIAGWLLAIFLLLPHATLLLLSLVPTGTWTVETLPPRLDLSNYRMLGDAASSPLVRQLGSPDQFSLGGGLVFKVGAKE